MLPGELKTEDFRGYPPEAKLLATQHIALLRELPLSFVPSLLAQLIVYDWKFPAEREQIDGELATLAALSSLELKQWFADFAAIRLSRELERFDWPAAPAQFVEELSAHLWTTHQMDLFRAAATHYAERLRANSPPKAPALSRLLITVVGQGVKESPGTLFRRLRPYGVHFTQVNPEGGVGLLLNAVESRAKSHPQPFAHWYIDGGQNLPCAPSITCVSYTALEPVHRQLLRKIDTAIHSPNMGPERLRTMLAELTPAELGFDNAADPVLSRFQLRVFTEGSGTQIFSTSFAQWTARECLRRAQPLTLLVRFAPRQRQRPMNELLSPTHSPPELDPVGSLIDADMGAYYNWIDLQRLPGAEHTSTLVWFEDHREALLIAPSLPRGTDSAKSATLADLLRWAA
jgi:hypothetical protein